MSESKAATEALRHEIVRLAQEGDLTPDTLMRIMRVARAGRDLLVSLDASPKSLAQMVKRPSPGFGGIGMNAVDADLGGAEEPGGMGQTMGGAYAYSSPTENFGMTALREIIGALKGRWTPDGGADMVKLVEAVAVAREKGLEDVARALEAKLGLTTERPALPAPVAAAAPMEAAEKETVPA